MKNIIIKISSFTEKANQIIQFVIYLLTFHGAISLSIYFKTNNIKLLKNIPEFLFLMLIIGILNLTVCLIITLYYLSPNFIKFVSKEAFQLKGIDELTTITFFKSELTSRILTKLIIITTTPFSIALSYILTVNETPKMDDHINTFGIILLISIYLSLSNK